MLGFTNLHSHTCYSQLDAIVRASQLFKRAKELGQTAVAVTDHGVMSGIYEAYKASKATGVKLIPGNEIYFVDDLSDEKSKRRHLVLLAANHEGYKNLLKITAQGFQNATVVMGREYPRVDEAILRKYSDGLFAASACGGSIIAYNIFNKDMEKAKHFANLFRDIFGDRFYIELQPHNLTRTDKKTGITFDQRFLNHKLKEIAEELGIQMIATCDSHYLTPKHEKYHDMVLAISDKKPLDDLTRHRYATYMSCALCEGSGKYPKDSEKLCISCAGTGIGRILPCPEFYVKSEEEIRTFFKKEYSETFADTLIKNTASIASRCEEPKYLEPTVDRLPRFDWSHINQCDDAEDYKAWLASKPNMQAIAEENSYLRYKVWKVFKVYTKDFSVEDKKTYWDRLLFEIDILESRNFCSYMLIVADFINWARKNHIDVGPGRGSCAGCLVAFFLGIHTVDSIKYGLLFERFQNKEKKSLPDIDTDLSPRGRERVVEYVRNKYGARHVAYISNINTITPKVAISDIARSLNIGGDKSMAFKLAKEITADIPDKVTEDDTIIEIDTMDKALKYSKKLRVFVQEYPEVLDYANEIVGLPRAMSTHAAGVIISDLPLDDIVPLRTDKDGRVAVAYDKDVCEEVKLVKIDFLGLDTLDILRDAYTMAKEIGLDVPEPDNIPEYDELTFKLIRSGRVGGCFQLEGTTLAPLCKPMQPNSIEDIALINALGRPGVSKEERHDFIERKAGRKPVKYQHPLLASILKHTYGIKVYEEDMLHIAAAVAGWDKSKADSLRKIAKLKEKGIELQKKTGAEFIKDSIAYSKIPQEEAEMIWKDVILPFGKYGFNKSHAIAYSVNSYRTAYYKAHAMAPLLCAKLNAETNKTTSTDADIEDIKKDARSFGITIRPCDINLSKYSYSIADKKTIVTGLLAIKGLGDKALASIIANQPYSSFEDFLYRTSSSAVNKTAIQALAKAGAFDCLNIGRKFAFDNYEIIRKELNKHVKKLGDEFFEMGDKLRPFTNYLEGFTSSVAHLSKDEWEIKDKLVHEKDVLGTYLSGSVEQLFPGFFKGGTYSQSFNKVRQLMANTSVPLEGVVTGCRELIIKKQGKNAGRKFGKLIFENSTGESIDVTVWPDQYEKLVKYFDKPVPLRGVFVVNEYNSEKSLVLNSVERIGV